MRLLRYYAMVAFNWMQGCRFFWINTPGTPAGGYLDCTEKCCPYPVLFDWSVRACVKAGKCGCCKRPRNSTTRSESNG